MASAARPAFTLIELLVVITIIVLLLALLTPALDKAIYQAELVTCGARLNGIGGGVLTYAASNRRRYLYRPGVTKNPGNWEAPMLRNNIPPEPVFENGDDRERFNEWVGLDMLNCPLAGEPDLGIAENPTEDDVKIVAGFSMYFSWKWDSADPRSGAGMFKIGDRLGWNGVDGQSGQPRSFRFRILALDFDMQVRGDDWTIGSHPDKDGLMSQSIKENEGVGDAFSDATFGPFTWGRWEESSPGNRGPIDRNVLYDDGSVRRIVDNLWDDETTGRMTRVPQFASDETGEGDWSAYLPVD